MQWNTVVLLPCSWFPYVVAAVWTYILIFWCLLFSSDFFVSFFVSNITRKRLDQFAWNFQGRCGDHGTTWLHFGSIRVQVGGSKVNVITGHSYLVWLWSSGSPVLPPSDWECNEIAVFGLSLRRSRGRGLLCPAPQLVLHFTFPSWLT